MNRQELLDRAQAHAQIGVYSTAISILTEAVSKDPGFIAGFVMLGAVWDDAGNYNDALKCWEKALALKPTSVQAIYNMAVVHGKMGNVATSAALFDRAVQLRPEYAAAAWNRSLQYLKLGDLENGWRGAEARLVNKHGNFIRPDSPVPYWQGEDPKDKRIYLWAEQGIGDIILGLSMLQSVIDAGGVFTVEAPHRMVDTVKRSFPTITVVGVQDHDAVPVLSKDDYDFRLPMMSLGGMVRTEFEYFPEHDGFLKPDPELVEQYRENYEAQAQGRPIVGISWKSVGSRMDKEKSIPIEALMPILSQDAFFVITQYGEKIDDIEKMISRDVSVWIDAVDHLKDFDHAIAQIAALDLLITTSNSSAHMAGGLGIPASVMLPNGVGSFWYWFMSRQNCPWYPSVRLFRTDDEAGASRWFETPIAAVAADLAKALAEIKQPTQEVA